MSAPARSIRTQRLLLRPWKAGDYAPFAALNADPAVMQHFPAVLSRRDSDDLAARLQAALSGRGWGFWALEVTAGPDEGRFAGFTGLSVPNWQAPFTPCVEVGWRLATWAWGRGYATEAAQQALRFGFSELGLTEVVSFTTVGNARSRAVMARIGMVRDPDADFDHPTIPSGDCRRYVLYRVSAESWRAQTQCQRPDS